MARLLSDEEMIRESSRCAARRGVRRRNSGAMTALFARRRFHDSGPDDKIR
jgi:hypothetical protein